MTVEKIGERQDRRRRFVDIRKISANALAGWVTSRS